MKIMFSTFLICFLLLLCSLVCVFFCFLLFALWGRHTHGCKSALVSTPLFSLRCNRRSAYGGGSTTPSWRFPLWQTAGFWWVHVTIVLWGWGVTGRIIRKKKMHMTSENERHTSSFLHKCFCTFYMKCTSQYRCSLSYTSFPYICRINCWRLYIHLNIFETKWVSLTLCLHCLPSSLVAVSFSSVYAWSMTLLWC